VRTEVLKGGLLSTLIIASLVVPAISLLSVSPSSATPEGLTPHAPVYIEGNDDFTAVNGVVAGSGTESDPYIIENWDISAKNANGIEIRNTTAYFVIRNCYVQEGRNNYRDGIVLHNSKNGKIDNNLVGNNQNGILLQESDNNLVSNNVVRNNGWGIRLDNSDINLVSSNLVDNHYHGISLSNSDNNFVSGNLVENNIYYSISLWDFSDNNLVSSNLVKNNRPAHGILLRNLNNNVVSGNLVENNYSGIHLYGGSGNNFIYHNNIVNNTNQAHDDGANYWDDGYPSGGNYWSDYAGKDAGNDGIGDTPYDILGDNNQDRYPLMNPFVPEAKAPAPWPLIAGIVAIIVIIGIVAALYMRRRKPRELSFGS